MMGGGGRLVIDALLPMAVHCAALCCSRVQLSDFLLRICKFIFKLMYDIFRCLLVLPCCHSDLYPIYIQCNILFHFLQKNFNVMCTIV